MPRRYSRREVRRRSEEEASEDDSDDTSSDRLAYFEAMGANPQHWHPCPKVPVAVVMAATMAFAATVCVVLQPSEFDFESSPSSSRVRATKKVSRPGVVDSIYTYGAPPTANPALENLLSGDRCFKGLRSYTENIIGPVTKQVDVSAMSTTYLHARMPLAALHVNNDTIYVPGAGEPSWPLAAVIGTFVEWALHWLSDYEPRLKSISINGSEVSTQEPFATAHKFVGIAFKAYDPTLEILDHVPGTLPGWKLVGRLTRSQGSVGPYVQQLQRSLMLVQDSTTLDCALVFGGKQDEVGGEIAMFAESYSSGYCGFPGVHAGYRNELRGMLTDWWPEFRPKLAKCSKVTCVGHGSGGALCELFAACANSGRAGNTDYEQQRWMTTTPEAMEELSPRITG